MSGDALGYVVDGRTARIELNQPTKRNAISAAMWRRLPDLIAQAEGDRSVKALVISGAGGHFAAGADISEFDEVYADREKAETYTRTMLSALDRLENAAKPAIAMIRGACMGGGVSIALACDFRFADDTAEFAIPPARLGIVYSADDTKRLIAAVGVSAAKRLLMTAERLTAHKAKEIGLVDEVIDSASLSKTVEAFVDEIAARSQWSVRATKKMFRLIAAGEDAAAIDLGLDGFESPDFVEGRRAFLEKRKARFPST
ncbi:MAG: enoyl-CoA hydratase-related protein [Pseudomonadota bacterium]